MEFDSDEDLDGWIYYDCKDCGRNKGGGRFYDEFRAKKRGFVNDDVRKLIAEEVKKGLD
jgi:hypothetical protein